jgi:endoglucanase
MLAICGRLLRIIQGTANLASADPPLTALGGSDGAGQMSHFVKQDGLNVFRLRQ